MTNWLLTCTTCLLFALISGDDMPRRSDAADLVHPTPGHPLSLEQVEERSSRTAGGIMTREVIHARVYRDRSGKLRTDTRSGDGLTVRTMLIDPMTGIRTLILPEAKIAYRMSGPKYGESGFALGSAGMGESLPPSHKWTTKTELKGKRKIDGIEYELTLTTQVAEDDPHLKNLIGRWYSESLGLTARVEASGPYGTHKAHVQNVVFGEPDPALFSIPPEYEVIDIPLQPQSSSSNNSR